MSFANVLSKSKHGAAKGGEERSIALCVVNVIRECRIRVRSPIGSNPSVLAWVFKSKFYAFTRTNLQFKEVLFIVNVEIRRSWNIYAVQNESISPALIILIPLKEFLNAFEFLVNYISS